MVFEASQRCGLTVAALSLLALLAGPASSAATPGAIRSVAVPAASTRPTIELDVVLVATDTASPRYEAQAVRRLLEATHGKGFWPVTLAVTPQSLEALLRTDPGLQRLILETRPTVIFVGAPPKDGGLAACSLLGRKLDLIPAAGGGAVGELLREDSALWHHAWSREQTQDTRPTFIPAGRLAAGRPVADVPDPTVDRWTRGWTAAQADAGGVVVQRDDIELVLEDIAAMAALARSLGLDPFAVPDLDEVLRKDLRGPQPPDLWSPVPLPSERRALVSAADTSAAQHRLQKVAGVLARFVLSRAEPAQEAAARIAELRTEAHLEAVQVFRASHLRPGPTGQATLRRMQSLVSVFASLGPRVQPLQERSEENTEQWTLRSAGRWETVFGTLPDELGGLVPGELERLHRDYRRREQRRRARLR